MKPSRLATPPPAPHEHGGWALLFLPLVLGTAAGRSLDLAPLLVWPAVVLGFFARYAALPVATRLVAGKSSPREVVTRRLAWSAIYLLASGACLLAAILAAPRGSGSATLVLAIVAGALALAHAGLALAGRDRSIGGELVGMTGLAASGPLVMAAAGRPLDGRSWGVAAIVLVYALSSLSLVRAFRALPRDRIRPLAACSAVHVALGALLAGLWWAGWIPVMALAGLALLVARAAWGLLAPPRNLRIIGMREVAVAFLYASMATAALLIG
jgi:heme/copper-type cytochrome/quinol oxidase subunit 3